VTRSLTFAADTRALASLGDRLGTLQGGTLEDVATKVVNEVGERTFSLARGRMLAGLSLTDVYLRNRMGFTPAPTSARPRAVVLAQGDLTTLGHYAPAISTQAAKSPKRSKGNPALGIAAGQKLAGVSVAVRRGGRKDVRAGKGDVFLMPSRRDSEGNPLIFQRIAGGKTRNGKDKLKALLGPSVYQLFSYQIDLIQGEVETDLAETLIERTEAAFLDALT